MDDSDAKHLADYALHGDERAFQSLVERHLGLVFGVAWRQTRDHSLAEEIWSSARMNSMLGRYSA